MMHAADTEIDRNFEAFRSLLPGLLQAAPGKYALMHAQRVVDLFDSSKSAVIAGLQQFGDGQYSVQQVTEQADNLGFYSYAGGAGQA